MAVRDFAPNPVIPAGPLAPADPTDPALLSPAQRLDELAALLAAGVWRWLQTRPPQPLPPAAEESSDDPLEVRAQTRLHVPRG